MYIGGIMRKSKSSKNQKKIIITLFALCLAILYLMLFISANLKPVIPNLVVKESIKYWLHTDPNHVSGNIKLQHPLALDELYRKSNHSFIWMDNYEVNSAGKKLIDVLSHTASDAWKNYRYRIKRLENDVIRLTNKPKDSAAIDVLLSDAYIVFAKQVLNNELLPNTGELDHPSFKKVKSTPTIKVNTLSVISLLSQSWSEGKLEILMDSFIPQHDGYIAMGKELNRYQKIVDENLWFPLLINNIIKVGDINSQLPRLRWMLSSYGDLDINKNSPSIAISKLDNINVFDKMNEIYRFDEKTSNALKVFQKRHGITSHGYIDNKTLQKLNIHPFAIAEKIALNMKRWRYLPGNMGDRYILVNMANFSLDLIDDNESILQMKVVIGKTDRRTPVLVASINTIVLSPTWNVPHRIAVNDIVPRAKKDPNFLKERGYTVLEGWQTPPVRVNIDSIDWDGFQRKLNTYRLVQHPSHKNALGDVKFIIPNDRAIYLHDTNHKNLFQKDIRALSSGCIRVERPIELAKAILNSETWSTDRLKSFTDKSITKVVNLKTNIPVYLMYWTSWIDSDGNLNFRDDVYDRDVSIRSSSEINNIAL